MKWLVVMAAWVLGGCVWQPLSVHAQRGDAAFVQRQAAIARAAQAEGDLPAAIAAWRAAALVDGTGRAAAQITRLEAQQRRMISDLQSRAGDDARHWLRLLLLDDDHPAALHWFAQRDAAERLSPLVFSDPPQPPMQTRLPRQMPMTAPHLAAERAARAEALYQRARRAAGVDLRSALKLYRQVLELQPQHTAARQALEQTQRMLHNLETIRSDQ